jgi:5'-nucleotidase
MGDPWFILGVDLDGVCGDHTEAFRRVVSAEHGLDPATLADQTTWNFHEWGLDDDQFLELHRRGVLDHRMFRDMPVIEGCADALWRLSDAGVWIRLITHRLYANWGHAVAVGDTVAWLDASGIPYRDLCFLGNKPQVEAHVYVDDAPHNVAALRAEGNHVIVFDQPYNRHVDGPRAHGWDEVEKLVLERMVAQGVPVQQQFSGLDDPLHRIARATGPRRDESVETSSGGSVGHEAPGDL